MSVCKQHKQTIQRMIKSARSLKLKTSLEAILKLSLPLGLINNLILFFSTAQRKTHDSNVTPTLCSVSKIHFDFPSFLGIVPAIFILIYTMTANTFLGNQRNTRVNKFNENIIYVELKPKSDLNYRVISFKFMYSLNFKMG